jgi:hypothetical protein
MAARFAMDAEHADRDSNRVKVRRHLLTQPRVRGLALNRLYDRRLAGHDARRKPVRCAQVAVGVASPRPLRTFNARSGRDQLASAVSKREPSAWRAQGTFSAVRFRRNSCRLVLSTSCPSRHRRYTSQTGAPCHTQDNDRVGSLPFVPPESFNSGISGKHRPWCTCASSGHLRLAVNHPKVLLPSENAESS